MLHLHSICLHLTVSSFQHLGPGLQMVCAGEGGGGGVVTSGGEALVSRVAAVVPGTSEAAARQALHVASGDYQGAVRFLKVEKLYRSGYQLWLCLLYRLKPLLIPVFFHQLLIIMAQFLNILCTPLCLHPQDGWK